MIPHAGAAKQANWPKGTLGGKYTRGFSRVRNLKHLLNSPLEQEKHLVKSVFFRSHQNHPDIIDCFPEHLHNSQIERSLEAAQAP